MYENIINNKTYKEVLKDSFGGVLYNVANEEKYDVEELTILYNNLSSSEKSAMDGIMKGAFNFLKIDKKNG